LREALAEMLAHPETRRLVIRELAAGMLPVRGGSPSMPATEVSGPGPFGAGCTPPGGDYSFPAKLGIGTASPAQTLDVAGNIGISGTEIITSGRVLQDVTVPADCLPVASPTTAGIVSTEDQTFAGSKTFGGQFTNLGTGPSYSVLSLGPNGGTNPFYIKTWRDSDPAVHFFPDEHAHVTFFSNDRVGPSHLDIGTRAPTEAAPLWDSSSLSLTGRHWVNGADTWDDATQKVIVESTSAFRWALTLRGQEVARATYPDLTFYASEKLGVGDTEIVSNARVLHNVTANAGIITSGALDDGRLPSTMSGKTFSGNVLPGSAGLDLGSAAQRWDVFGANGDFAGNVGIGTAAPAEKLEVAGKIRASGDHPILIDPTTGGVHLPDMDPPGDLYAAPKQYVDKKVAGIFNVKEFGATGDGTTDDTDAIQAAIGAAHTANGGVVFFPPGRYLVTNPDPNPEKRALQGLSKIALWGAGAGATIIRFKPGSSGNMLKFDGQSNFSIRNIQWDWNSVARDQGPILVTASSFFDITDCSFVNLGGPPIYPPPPPPPAPQPAHWGIHVVGSVVDSQDFCHDFRIERNYFKLPEPFGNTQNNALLAGRANGVINANHCDGSGVLVSGHDLKITNNVIHGFKYGSGIVAGPDAGTYEIQIIGNTIHDGTGLDKDGTWCAGIENWAPRSVISGNICHGCVGNGVANGGQRCTVTNNVCYDNGKGVLPPAWTNRKAAAVWEQVQPTNPNINHRYVCTVAGPVGDTEPNWPTDPGATVQDGSAVWKENGPRAAGVATWTNRKTPFFGERVMPTARNYHRYKCTIVGAVGDTEPSWPLPNPPTDPHPTVQDGSAVWQHDAPDANPDVYGIAIQHTVKDGVTYDSSESVYAGNRCFDSRPVGSKTQQYGIGDENATPSEPADVTIGINNLSGNAVAELDIKGSDYTILATSGGKLGIGKAEPTVRLHVAGGAADDHQLRLQAAAGKPAALHLTEGETVRGGIAADPTAMSIFNGSWQSSQAIHISQATGGVGIGKVPAEKLDVDGGVKASGAADVASLKIGGTEVITNGWVLQNVTFNPASLQIGGTEVITTARVLQNVTFSDTVAFAGLTCSLGSSGSRWLKLWTGEIDGSGLCNCANFRISGAPVHNWDALGQIDVHALYMEAVTVLAAGRLLQNVTASASILDSGNLADTVRASGSHSEVLNGTGAVAETVLTTATGDYTFLTSAYLHVRVIDAGTGTLVQTIRYYDLAGALQTRVTSCPINGNYTLASAVPLLVKSGTSITWELAVSGELIGTLRYDFTIAATRV
jgi:hypothetical protein